MILRLYTAFSRIAIILLCVLAISTCAPIDPEVLLPGDSEEAIRLAGLAASEIPGYLQNLERRDSITALYEDENTRGAVVAFFAELTHSERIARAILENSGRRGVPPGLAFALAYEESRFRVSAVNDNGDSVDRGIFQLNSKSFPELGEKEVFDPETNVRHGVAHLDYCLRTGGNEVAALAIYNAGHNRVTKGGTPRRTLDYIFRVIKYEENIASLFAARVAVPLRSRVTRARFDAAGPAGF